MAVQDYLPRQFNLTPTVVKNLLIINILFFVASIAFAKISHQDLNSTFGLYYPGSEHFRPFQILTSMFSHGGWAHLAFNMFALWMFGSQLERIWGSKRFLIYFLLTGLGASLLHTGVNWYELQQAWSNIEMEHHSRYMELIRSEGRELILTGRNYVDRDLGKLNGIYNGYVVGASGAIYGLLIGFGILFPNVELMLLFFPVPVKAKYFIPLLMIGELYLGMNNFSWDNIAHFAHLGGALFGFLIIKYWARGSNRFF